jgi:hypothetical protein
MTIKEAERIHHATTGKWMFLIKCDGGYRWSKYDEDDEKDDFDSLGGIPFKSPEDAIGTLWRAIGYLRGVRIPKEKIDEPIPSQV